VLSRDELVTEVLRLVTADSGLEPADLLEQVPKSARDEASRVAHELVEQGKLFRWAKGSQERFFAHDPIATLGKGANRR